MLIIRRHTPCGKRVVLFKRASSFSLSLSESSIKRLCSIDFLDIIRHKIVQQMPANTQDTSCRKGIRHKSPQMTDRHSHLFPGSRISRGDWCWKKANKNESETGQSAFLSLRSRHPNLRDTNSLQLFGRQPVTSDALLPMARLEREAHRVGSALCR